MATTVFVVDDHVLVRNAIARVISLEEDMEVVGEGTGSLETVEAVRRLCPAVVIVDLEMPGIRGADFIAMVKDASRRIRTLVCSMHASHGYVAEALRAGADGYVLKSSPSTLLMEGIRAVVAGQAYIDPALQTDVLQMLQNPESREVQKQLTAREIEVLRLAAEGLSNDEIARRTGQSLETVKLRMRRTFQKLGAADRTHAVVLALRRRLIQ